jgi:hypothetical protein
MARVPLLSLPFEELNRPLVLLSSRSRLERAEIPPFAGLWSDSSRVETVLPDFSLRITDF